MKQISPKPLYSLVMTTFTSNKAAPPWPSAGMGKHIPGFFNVISAFVTSDPRGEVQNLGLHFEITVIL